MIDRDLKQASLRVALHPKSKSLSEKEAEKREIA
jgi:hypothetical protein